MKKTLFYLVFIITMALSLGILTGCVQKESNIKEDIALEEKEDKNVKDETKVDEVKNEVDDEKKEKVEPISQVAAKKIINEKFELALDIYDLALFDYDSSEYISLEGKDNYYFIINNFEDIMVNFTEKGRSDLINNHGLIFEENGDYYIGLGSKAEWFSNYEISEIEIESEKITATMKVDVSVGEEEAVKGKEIPFVLELVDGKWIIDTYIDVSKVQNY